jgi:hypothetical protein
VDLELPENFHIIFPCILAGLCMPLVVMRAVMMELDCFVIRKRQLKSDFHIETQIENSVVNSSMNQPTLPNILSKNLKSKDIKCRL